MELCGKVLKLLIDLAEIFRQVVRLLLKIKNIGITVLNLEERGSTFFLTFGKLFNVLTKNSNSGILVYGGLGTIHHKIRIAFKDEIQSLSDEYKKGYDRLSFGYAANGFLGYMHLSKNRFLNFYGGVDFAYGQTKSLRKFN